jgi:hypothetical protein
MIKCHLKRFAVAKAIYEARFEADKGARPTPFEELNVKARDIWMHCADAASEAIGKKPRLSITAVAERRPFGRTRYAAH